MKTIPLLEGKTYHIYNRGNNRGDIFYENSNYYHFLRLYEKYVEPVTKTYAWCLLKNHFHFLVYIKTDSEINSKLLSYSTVDAPKKIDVSKQFSHFFNAYAQAINKRYERTGSLFEKNFERKIIESDAYFQNLIFYIHNNPVQHGFTDLISTYPWSSYGTIVSNKPTKLQRNKVVEIYNGVESFKIFHSLNHDLENIRDLMID